MISIITGALITSITVSVLFVATRVYYCYFAKPKKCSGGCSCEDAKDKRLVEMYCGTNTDVVPAAKPKRGRRPKQGAESLGDFALKAADKIEKRRGKKS